MHKVVKVVDDEQLGSAFDELDLCVGMLAFEANMVLEWRESCCKGAERVHVWTDLAGSNTKIELIEAREDRYSLVVFWSESAAVLNTMLHTIQSYVPFFN